MANEHEEIHRAKDRSDGNKSHDSIDTELEPVVEIYSSPDLSESDDGPNDDSSVGKKRSMFFQRMFCFVQKKKKTTLSCSYECFL